MKFVRNGRTHRRELLVAAQRGETLDTKRANKLVEDPSTLLLGFSYESQRGGASVMLHYDVEGLWSLRTYLAKRAMSRDELLGLLEAVRRVLDLCAEERLEAEGLLFDPEYVFVDAQCCPRFVLIPLTDVPFQTRNSPLMILQALGNSGGLRFAEPDAEGLSRRLGTFVSDQNGVFSANNFRRFVEDEDRQTDAMQPEAHRASAESGTSSVWVTAGAAPEPAPQNAGTLFWSPLAGMASGSAPEPAEAKANEAPVAAPVAPRVAQPAEMPAVVPVPVPVESPTSVRDAAPAEVEPAVTPAKEPAGEPVPVPVPAAPVSPAPVREQTPQPVAAPTNDPASQPAQTPAIEDIPSPVSVLPAARHVIPSGLKICRLRTGEQYVLPMREVTVGRGSACDIKLLGNRKLSRVHVALTNAGAAVVVRDMGAVNGVWVAGQRLAAQQAVVAQPGQSIRLADEELIILNG